MKHFELLRNLASGWVTLPFCSKDTVIQLPSIGDNLFLWSHPVWYYFVLKSSSTGRVVVITVRAIRICFIKFTFNDPVKLYVVRLVCRFG